MSWSYNPHIAVTTLVWANPRSLATTNGITFVFFSSRYLDVSVPWVCLLADTISSIQWVAPFGYLRINLYVPIPATFRSLSRPSSPLRAQAFPIRPCLAYCTFCLFNELLLSITIKSLKANKLTPKYIIVIPYYCSLAIIITFIKYFYLISCIFFQYVNERCQYELFRSALTRQPQNPILKNLNIKALSVENIGVEPMTSCVQGRRSSQLS